MVILISSLCSTLYVCMYVCTGQPATVLSLTLSTPYSECEALSFCSNCCSCTSFSEVFQVAKMLYRLDYTVSLHCPWQNHLIMNSSGDNRSWIVADASHSCSCCIVDRGRVTWEIAFLPLAVFLAICSSGCTSKVKVHNRRACPQTPLACGTLVLHMHSSTDGLLD